MRMIRRNEVLLMGLIAIISLVSVASAISGTATYYTVYYPNACGLENQGTMIAAASDALWDNGGACGRMYTITCTGGTNGGIAQPCKAGTSVTVKIIDRCPSPGCQGTFDLSQEAFSAIADINEGKIQIDYNQA